MTDNELGTTAAREAEALEEFDGGIEENPLVGDNVVSVSAEVAADGRLEDVSVGFNVMGARITVDVFAGILTAGAGLSTHRTHVDDDCEALRQAQDVWADRFDGLEVSV